jgi:hypothetical protein
VEITFISTYRFLITLLIIVVIMSLYAWKVRPYLRTKPGFSVLYMRADGFWAALWAWLKVRWDIASAAFIALLPILWNGILDLLIAVSLVLADVLPAVAGLDLSALVMPAWLKTSIQVGAALLPVLRGHMLKKSED